jgi:hypothetical protein
LTILLVALKSKEYEVIGRIKKCRIALIVWLIMFAGLMGYRFWDIKDNFEDEENEEAPGLWYAIIYTYICNIIVIAAYLALYIILRKAYTEVKITHQKLLTKEEVKQIDENLCSLLILQIAIIQICIYRILFETYN